MRISVTLLVSWVFLLYGVGRGSGFFHMTEMVYILTPLVAAVVLLVPSVRRLPRWGMFAAPVTLFLGLKIGMGYPVWGAALPLTMVEAGCIALTVALVREVMGEVEAFETAVANITIGRPEGWREDETSDQGKMYRELKRARYYRRPLALLAIGVDGESAPVVVDRVVQEAQRAMAKQYVMSRVAGVLCDELEDYNTIAHNHEYFLVLLPEMATDELPGLVNDLHEMIATQVGIAPQIGKASFPGDAATFDGLVSKAVEDMDRERRLAQVLQSQAGPTNRS